MIIKIKNGKLQININGGDTPVFEKVVSFTKLKAVMDVAIDSFAGPVSFPIPFIEENVCYDNIEINKNA